MRLDHERDPETLRQAAKLLEAENARLTAKVLELTRLLSEARHEDKTTLQLRLIELQRQLENRNRKIYGASSEKRQDSAPAEEPKRKQSGHGPHEQKELRVVEKLFKLDAPDQQCPKCGGELSEMKEQFEESEEITVLAREFVLQKIKRQKYRCGCNACVETALGPEKLFDGARYSIDFAIEIAVAKYLDHLPLDRQVRMMMRDGLQVTSQTLWDYLERLGRLLGSAHDALHAYVLSQAIIGADETSWKLLGTEGRETKTWQVWAVCTPDAVCYRIKGSRGVDSAREMFGDFSGVAMVDDYGAYRSLAKTQPQVTLANCWAHVRRKWIEVESVAPLEAESVLELIGALYEVEKKCTAGPADDALRARLRDEQSRPIVGRLRELLLDILKSRALPQSGLAKAAEYALGCWAGLVRFLEDPGIPLDNNATERAMRGVVLGRKNHYGSKSKRGTEVAALFYTLLESAKLAGRDPREYLRAATLAAVRGEKIPLPHEAAGTG